MSPTRFVTDTIGFRLAPLQDALFSQASMMREKSERVLALRARATSLLFSLSSRLRSHFSTAQLTLISYVCMCALVPSESNLHDFFC